MAKRKRKVWSIKEELLAKSREAMLNAVQIFNNPNIQFKSESFIVLSNIAWMYLLHAYYKDNNIEYRYFRIAGTRRRFDKTKRGAYKYWELERCLNTNECPIGNVTKSNLRFLIGLRHEIEHQMTTRIDDYLSARFQACCLNFNRYIKKFFGDEYGIDKHLSLSLQFSTIDEEQVNQLREFKDLPKNIATYIDAFDEELSEEEYNDIRFSYRVLYVPKAVNRKGQADKVVEFIPANSPEAEGLNKEYVLIKEKEKQKYLPSSILEIMRNEGYVGFGMHQHTLLWQRNNAKNPGKNFGVQVAKQWYWYSNWVEFVKNYCKEHHSANE
ncbi:DUF3644 domain-containing protein [Aquimarina sp. D1M17]|uniref:DUF3644 domain-containing protein n=1 Tax=Aquimarina acroporae TaxID=2937283 RepID=UPI0020BFD567|nr:DUF3644 domain-containing protein [Aquimarina acroporae]MCK8521916.1 DUF3644 domain-containing protein [Aquimarina acroporae]